MPSASLPSPGKEAPAYHLVAQDLIFQPADEPDYHPSVDPSLSHSNTLNVANMMLYSDPDTVSFDER